MLRTQHVYYAANRVDICGGYALQCREILRLDAMHSQTFIPIHLALRYGYGTAAGTEFATEDCSLIFELRGYLLFKQLQNFFDCLDVEVNLICNLLRSETAVPKTPYLFQFPLVDSYGLFHICQLSHNHLPHMDGIHALL